MSLLTKIFGDANQRFLDRLSARVTDINAHDTVVRELSDESLRKKTDEFKKSIEATRESSSAAIRALTD